MCGKGEIGMLYIIPKIENKPIKIVDTDVKADINDNGDIIISKKLDASEIAELFDISITDVLNGTVKFGIYVDE